MLSYISQVFHDNCVVNFAPPDDDGGTEIVKYVVEEMNVTEGGGWSEVAEVGPGDKKAKIDGLNSGDKYRFRVKAINKLGQVNRQNSYLQVSSSKCLIYRAHLAR